MKGFSKENLAHSDSSQTKDSIEKQYIISAYQMREIVKTAMKLDSLQKRFEDCQGNSSDRLREINNLSQRIIVLCDDSSQKFKTVIAIDKGIQNVFVKEVKHLNFRLNWQILKQPVIYTTVFILGNIAAQKGFVINLNF